MSYERETWSGSVWVYCYFEPIGEVVGDLSAWMDAVMAVWMEDYGYSFDDREVWVYNFEIVEKGGKPQIHLVIQADIEGEGEDDFEAEGDAIAEGIVCDLEGLADVARILESGWDTVIDDIDTWYDEDAAYEAWRDSRDD